MVNPRKKPKFSRQGAKYLKRVKKTWRRPKGRHSKLREKRKSKGKTPSVGYRSPKNIRGLHPSGLREVLVENINQLEKIDSKEEAVRISAKIGKRKKGLMLKRAKDIGLKILNP